MLSCGSRIWLLLESTLLVPGSQGGDHEIWATLSNITLPLGMTTWWPYYLCSASQILVVEVWLRFSLISYPAIMIGETTWVYGNSRIPPRIAWQDFFQNWAIVHGNITRLIASDTIVTRWYFLNSFELKDFKKSSRPSTHDAIRARDDWLSILG